MKKTILLNLFLVCIFLLQAQTAKYYVTSTGSGINDGSSWANASTNLKTILDGTVAGDTVWVASGTYKPTETTNRLISFNIKDGIKVFGGFSGTETNLNQRDIVANKTILSGNIGVEADSTDNSSTVVNLYKCSANTELDGITISDGQTRIPIATINSPSSLTGNFNLGYAAFGPTAFNITGDVILAEPLIACGAITNNVSGKIVLIQRGTCSFKSKALYAQTAGAIGIIIYNNVTGDVTDPMGNDLTITTEITIPVVSLSLANGTAIKNALTTDNVNITISKINYTIGGGALNMINSTCKVNHCTIKNNFSTKGAVLCDSTSNPIFSICTFDRNKTTYSGGAVHSILSQSTFINCNFKNNTATYGGAVYNDFSGATFTNCTFENNIANSGGAVYNNILQNIYTNCSFLMNKANYGGAIYNQTSSFILSGCFFSNNTVAYTGGAIYQNTSNSTISNSIFDANQSQYAGAIYIDANSSSNINQTTFYNNFATGGGAIYSLKNLTINNSLFEINHSTNSGAAINFAGGTNTLNNTIFIRNSTDVGTTGSGGAIQLMTNPLVVVNTNNCLFADNQAKGTDDDGGGAIMIYSGTLNLKNSTIAQNSSATQGGAIRIKDINGKAYIENSILWGNTAGVVGTEQINNTGGKDSVSYSIVQCDSVYVGIGNVNSDPLFLNPINALGVDHYYRTADDGFTLQANSPAINSGNPASNSLPTDIGGNTRVGYYDIGAYESPYTLTGIQKLFENDQLIYPNPATDRFFIQAGEKTSVLFLYDLNGALILVKQILGKTEINISSLQQGIYVVKMNGLVGKLIKK